MSELKIIYKPIGELKGYEKNSRTHSEEQIQQIANSITEFGFTNPILIDEENTIIAGHGRLEASKLMGKEDVPTITLTGLSDIQKKAYVIADNKLALNAGWDYSMLSEQIEELNLEEFNPELLGFNEFELAGFSGVEEFSEPEITDLSEKKEVYDNADIKRIILMYNTDDFEEVNRLSSPLLEELQLEDNSALFKFLVEKHTGDNRIDEGS